MDCGTANPIVLQFDHVDPYTKRAGVSRMVQRGYSVKAIQAEIDKCVVRCGNCHAHRTSKQFNWAKAQTP